MATYNDFVLAIAELEKAIADQQPPDDALAKLKSARDEYVREQADPDRMLYIEKARELFAAGSSDELEIDDDAQLSEGDDGTWVQAWVWVQYENGGHGCTCGAEIENDDEWEAHIATCSGYPPEPEDEEEVR